MLRKHFLLCGLLSACAFLLMPFEASGQKEPLLKIVQMEDVAVKCPVGTAPRLPYRLWVSYDNGRSEYRQVKWMN